MEYNFDKNQENILDNLPVLDREAALRSVDMDQEFLEEINTVFLEELPERVKNIQVAVQDEDIEALAKIAHGIRSAAATIGAMRLSQTAEFLETACRENVKTRVALQKRILEELRNVEHELKPG
ncbi:MAG: Hpt domain-containing protein [Spirochaetales bacterium]|nr:Hpt domain-containing protein [Spirochaetales bacterium]